MKCNKYLFYALISISSLVLFSKNLYAQGNTCATATTFSADCTSPTSYNLTSATNTVTPSCGGNTREGWYTFTATSTFHVVNVTADTRNVVVSAYEGTCASAEIACANANGNGGSETLSLTTTPGQTYFIQLTRNNGNGNMSGTICLSSPLANDECTGAIDLTVNTGACVPVEHTNVNATFGNAASGGNPSCANGTGSPDVWFRFVASNASTDIETQAGAVGAIGDTGMQLYSSDGTCNNLASLECNDDGGTGLYSLISRNDLIVGQTYYIRIWGFSGATGTFNICVTSPAPIVPPANDECTGAFDLNVGQFECSFGGITTENATYSNTFGGDPTCASGTGSQDVWYKFVAPAGGQAVIDTQAGSITNSGMELYHSTDGTCNTLTSVACDDNSGSGSMSRILDYNLTGGDTYYLRVWDAGGGDGTMDICIQNQYSDCDVSFPLCSSSSFNTNSFGPGAVDSNIGNCFSGGIDATELQSIWINFEIQTTGTLSFIIDSQNPGGDDYDFNLFRANTCTDISGANSVSCNASSTTGTGGTTGIDSGLAAGFGDNNPDPNSENPGGGNPFNDDLNVIAGERYYIVINNFSATGIGFDLSFDGTAGLDCVVLPVELTEFGGEKVKEQNLLHWATAREYNTSHFEIERSQDAMDFIKIGELKSGNKKLETQIYQYWDNEPQVGINYYRLKQVDLDGTFTYTKTIAIDNQGIITTFEIQKMYPNPAQNAINFVFTVPTSNSEIQVEVFDSNGKSVSKNINTYQKGVQNFNQNLSSFSKGLYILRISNLKTGETLTEKFIKQ
ncbi:T9SS type A sorting domain-containing protein [Bernardetia sp.]|uniref:T9SS type A sorting domain-containing protein n=1 Tax=Bernardetia sp. TaxID=1937974 RepID=UPI0025BBEF64|nr:T9SS type A sorting domain-containing protein [Bernardetia sp.]